MKNLIEPKIIEEFLKSQPSFEEIEKFLEKNSNIPAALFCKMINLEPRKYYDWRWVSKKRQGKAESKDAESRLGATAVKSNGKYSAAEKLSLVRAYSKLENGQKTEFLRGYGLYQSDIKKWEDIIDGAALAALSVRKVRSDKKSDVEIENGNLKGEIAGHEKTIAKLAALVMVQKKVSEILSGPTQK
jgi:hypothetical protein